MPKAKEHNIKKVKIATFIIRKFIDSEKKEYFNEQGFDLMEMEIYTNTWYCLIQFIIPVPLPFITFGNSSRSDKQF